jgi:hypothetical protein
MTPDNTQSGTLKGSEESIPVTASLNQVCECAACTSLFRELLQPQ